MTRQQNAYERWLRQASYAERRLRNLRAAVKCLARAEKFTNDNDELKYLHIWQNRLRLEIKQGGGATDG